MPSSRNTCSPLFRRKPTFFVVTTDKDNINLMVGQWVKQKYQVKRVVTVVHDPVLAGLYRELGLETVCPTDLVINDVLQMIQGK